jgi:hypothetical protein
MASSGSRSSFADPRKIAAAFELELAQLPVAIETCTSDFQRRLPMALAAGT